MNALRNAARPAVEAEGRKCCEPSITTPAIVTHRIEANQGRVVERIGEALAPNAGGPANV